MKKLTEEEKQTIKNFENDFMRILNMYLYNNKIYSNKFDIKEIENLQYNPKYRLFKDQQRLLLQYLYIQGVIIINILYTYLLGTDHINRTELNTLNIIDDIKQKIYCFKTYRNKFIEHHEFLRNYYLDNDINDIGTIKLLPEGQPQGQCINYIKEIKDLSLKYHYPDKFVIFDIILSWLFYNIPFTCEEDRNSIENIIKKTGNVSSMNHLEINNLIKDFLKEIQKNYY